MSINLTVVIDNDEAIKKFKELQNVAKQTTSNIVTDSDRMDMAIRKLGKGLASLGLTVSITEIGRQIATVRGEFQQLEVAFKTMLGSKAEADALMADVVNMAASTPFDLQGVAGGAKQLLAYGSAAEDVTNELRMLGDIAAGLSLPLGDLVYLYGTTRVQGRMFTQDLRQFTGRGIPLIAELAKQFGVAESEVGELVTAGKVGFEEMRTALVSMTSEGGKFYNLMEEQSKTISGQMSNLSDSIQQMFNEIGKQSEGAISKAISSAAYLVKNYEEVGRILMDLVAAYGSYKTAIMVVNAAQLAAAKNITLVTYAVGALRNAIVGLNLAQYLTNPYLALGAVVAATIFGIYKMVTARSAEEKAIDKVNKRLEEYGKAQDEMKNEALQNANTMKDSSAAILTRVQAYKDLVGTYPELLEKYDEEKIKLMELKDLEVELDQIKQARIMTDLRSRKEEITNKLNEINSRKVVGVNGELAFANASDRGVYKTLSAELDVINNKLREQIRLQEEVNFEGLSKQEKIALYESRVAAIDELLASMDKLRKAESAPILTAERDELTKKIKTLKDSGEEEKTVNKETQEEIDKARKNAKKSAIDAEIDLEKSKIKDRVKLLEYEKQLELDAIDKRIKETTDRIVLGYLERERVAKEALYDSQIADATIPSLGGLIPQVGTLPEMKNQPTKPTFDEVVISKEADAIVELFGDMRNKSVKDLREIADAARAMLGTFSDDPQTKAEILKWIEELDEKIIELESPLEKLKNSLKELFSSEPGSEKWHNAIDGIRSGLSSVIDVVEALDSVLDSLGAGEALDSVLDGMNAAKDALDSAKKGAEMGVAFGGVGVAVGAAVGAIGSLVKSIAQIHDKKNEKRIKSLQNDIDNLGDAYEDLERKASKAYSTGKANIIEDENKNLEKQKALIEEQIKMEEDKKKTDPERIKQYEDQIRQIDQAIEDNGQKAQEAITGISFDSFYENFVSTLSGMDASSEDFAKNFEEYMFKALIGSLVANKYQNALTELYNQFTGAMDDGTMTDAEREEYRRQYQAIIDDAIEERNNIADMMGYTGDGSSKSSATSKGFQTMSQETGSELNGRFTDIQGKVTEIRSFVMDLMATGKLQYAETVNMRDIMIQINGNVADIKTYAKVLPEMRDSINLMNKKLDNL